MNFLANHRQQSIDTEVQKQASYVVGAIQEQIDAGQEPPYVAYARVRGLSPEDTARNVGHVAIDRLDGQFILDAKVAEEESTLVREGAIIRVLAMD
jgi:hypothetical protein